MVWAGGRVMFQCKSWADSSGVHPICVAGRNTWGGKIFSERSEGRGRGGRLQGPPTVSGTRAVRQDGVCPAAARTSGGAAPGAAYSCWEASRKAKAGGAAHEVDARSKRKHIRGRGRETTGGGWGYGARRGGSAHRRRHSSVPCTSLRLGQRVVVGCVRTSEGVRKRQGNIRVGLGGSAVTWRMDGMDIASSRNVSVNVAFTANKAAAFSLNAALRPADLSLRRIRSLLLLVQQGAVHPSCPRVFVKRYNRQAEAAARIALSQRSSPLRATRKLDEQPSFHGVQIAEAESRNRRELWRDMGSWSKAAKDKRGQKTTGVRAGVDWVAGSQPERIQCPEQSAARGGRKRGENRESVGISRPPHLSHGSHSPVQNSDSSSFYGHP
ncbi:hypothetical protein C8R45DRAFT_945508 [Mycena sanguinolenta]|nr:hypothetical protein C8R45DRAFT_945508 [Mycena sanguinolenta]